MEEDKEKPLSADQEEDFEELLAASTIQADRLELGEKVKAAVLKVTPEWVFIDLGRKSEGYISAKEFVDEEGKVSIKEGDTIEAFYFPRMGQEELFTTRIGRGEIKRFYLEEAWRNGIPVEGLVEREMKGGFEIRIGGNIRGFCPYSQMGLQRVNDPQACIGERLAFKITQYGEKGRNIILSNRLVLEEEKAKQRELLRASLREGMPTKGKISALHDFGAFIDVGGIQGLIPISEVSWGPVEDIRQLLSAGQEVEVIAVRLDWQNERFTFSIKKAQPNPWQNAAQKYPEGSRHTGKVVRLKNFGAFISLQDGVDGLIHISKLRQKKNINHPREVLAVGQTIEVKVESIDAENRRLSLSLVESGTGAEEAAALEDFRKHLEKQPKSMGTLGDLLKAKLENRKK